MLKKQKQKLCVPNFHQTFDELSEMVNFAVTNRLLEEVSILYSSMLDALSQLKLKQNSYSDESSREGHKPQSKPHNKRWDPLTIKLAVSLSVKCKQKGYEAVRKWLPLLSWRLVQEYRNMDTYLILLILLSYKNAGMKLNSVVPATCLVCIGMKLTSAVELSYVGGLDN